MHLLRGHVEGGEAAHQEGVVGVAVRQLGGAEALAGAGQVLVLEEAEEVAVGRHHALQDRLAAGGAQALAVPLRHADRERLEGAQNTLSVGSPTTCAEIVPSYPASATFGIVMPRSRPRRMFEVCSPK